VTTRCAAWGPKGRLAWLAHGLGIVSAPVPVRPYVHAHVSLSLSVCVDSFVLRIRAASSCRLDWKTFFWMPWRSFGSAAASPHSPTTTPPPACGRPPPPALALIPASATVTVIATSKATRIVTATSSLPVAPCPCMRAFASAGTCISL
jgi:hypothetical protein